MSTLNVKRAEETVTPRENPVTCIMQRWIRDAGLEALELRLQARHAVWLWTVLAVALVARAVIAVVVTDFDLATANIWEYGGIARATLEHGQMVCTVAICHTGPGDLAAVNFFYPTAYMPPFLIFLWIGLFVLFGVTKLALASMTALNVFMGVGIVYYSIRVTSSLLGSEITAVLVGIIMALHPVFVYSVATYHALNLYILVLLAAFDLTCSSRRQTFSVSIVVGALAGIAALVRLEYLGLVGAIMLGSVMTHRQWRMTAVAAVVAFVVIAPWTARNYIVFQQFIPVANVTGYNLYKGFNPEANGSGNWVDDNKVAERLLGHKLVAVPLDLNYEDAVDKVYLDAAIDYMKMHPVRSFAILPICKAALFWLYDITDPMTHQPLYQLQFWPLFVLSIIGLAMAARAGYFSRPDHRTILILFVVQTLVMASYAVHARYRMNVEPFLYAYAALGAVGALGLAPGTATSFWFHPLFRFLKRSQPIFGFMIPLRHGLLRAQGSERPHVR